MPMPVSMGVIKWGCTFNSLAWKIYIWPDPYPQKLLIQLLLDMDVVIYPFQQYGPDFHKTTPP
jgi:hypothetical protein